MAYGTKYFAFYKSGNVERSIHLQLEGYPGPPTEWFCSVNDPTDEQGSTDKLFGDVLVPKIVRFEFLFNEHYDLREFVGESRTYKVLIYEDLNLKFEGFLEPYDTYKAYQKPNYFVSMTATCGLNRLSKNIFPQTEFNEGNLTLSYFEIVQRCLATIGIDRGLRVSLFTQQNAYPSSPNPLLSAEINVFRYFVGGAWMDCQSILIDILDKFNAQLFLDEKVWVIRSFIDHSLGETASIQYDPESIGGSIINRPVWDDLIRQINYTPGEPKENAVTLNGGQIRLNPRVRKYTLHADMGGKSDQFNNGGLQLWDVNGPVGWEGNMGPAAGGIGWTKVETGIEGSPYALHVRGIAPPPYYKTKKKGIWPFRKTVKTPIEPETYWETPEIEIKKTDESMTIGFEYFTEANSAGFFYTITLFTTNPVEKGRNRVYLKPDAPGFPYSDEYTLLTAPPHPKVNPETGITQSKGKIEYNLDLKQLNNAEIFYDRIEIWFYFSVQEEGKTGDEYTIYKILGEKTVAAESEVPDGDSQYRVTLESNPYESDEGDTINLISGDYAEGYLGTTHGPQGDLTSRWSRRGRSEAISIYRAMLWDRLAVTYNVADVIQCDIKILAGQDLKYTHILRFLDRNSNSKYKIVRYSFNHYTRIASVVAVEVTYADLNDIKQRSFTEARGLLDEEADGDGIYPGDGTPSGRVGAEENFEDDPTEEDIKNARTGLFEDLPAFAFIYGEESTDSIDLSKYFSELYLAEQDEEIEEEDRHDPYALRFFIKSKPAWITDTRVVYLVASATAKPTQIGSFSLVFSVVDDTFGIVNDVEIQVIVYPKTKASYLLLETSSGEALSVGALPGAYPVPTKADIQISITGSHDFYQLTLEGGGDTGKAFKQTVNQFVERTSSATYRFFQEDNGDVLPEGVYRLYAYTAVSDKGVFRQDITFILGGDEFLAKAKFYFISGGADVGEIDPSGTSKFPDPGTWDSKIVIDDVEHDKAIVRLIDDGGGVVHERTIEHGAPVMDGEYLIYGSDQAHEIGIYTASISLFLADEEVLARYADFETVKEVPEPVGGALQLLKKSATGVNFSVVATLPKTGTSAQTLVPWNIGSDAVTDPFDWEGGELFELKGGGLIKVDVSSYTGRPPYVAYPYEVTFSDYREFDNLSSEDIGKIHGNNKTFRYIRTRKLGGQSGDTVAVFQADFSFGTLVPIEDDVEVEEPGSGYVDFRAREGMSEEPIDYVKYFDVRVDNLTIEIKEPGNPDKNWLGLIEKGVLYKYIQDMPADTVLGRRDTAGTPGPIQIKKLLADVDPGDLVYIDVIQELIDQELEGYMPISSYTLDWNLVNSGGGSKYNTSSVNNPLGGGTIFHGEYINHESSPNYGTSIAFRNNRGFFRSIEAGIWQPWLEFADRAWVTANYVPLTRQILNGIGLSGGGSLSADRTLSVLYGTAAGTSAQGNDTRINNGQTAFTWGDHSLVGYLVGAYSSLGWSDVNTPAMFRINTSATDNPFGGGSIFHGVWIPHDVGTTYGTSLAFRNNRGFFRSLEAGSWQTWLEFADRAWVDAHTVGAGAGLTGGGTLGSSPVISMGLPSTLSNATTNSTSGSTHTHAIQVSNLIAGINVSLSSSGVGVVLGPNNITINVGSFPWNDLTGKPTTIDGFGLTDAYKKIEIDGFLTGKENTFSKGDIIQGAGLSITGTLTDKLVGSSDVTFALASSGVSAGTYRSVTVDIYGRVTSGANPNTLAGYGLDSTVYTKSQVDALIPASSPVTVSGVSTNRLVKWSNGSLPGDLQDSFLDDSGNSIYFLNPARMLNVTRTERLALTPETGMLVYQTATVGASLGGIKLYLVNQWVHIPWNVTDA